MKQKKLKESTEDIKSVLERAYKGSYFTVEGADGEPQEWVDGLNKMFAERNIGQIKDYIWISGKDMNEWAHLTGGNAYQDDFTFFAFPLDGLDPGKLIPFKFRFGARWFDDIVDNNADREGFHPMGTSHYDEDLDVKEAIDDSFPPHVPGYEGRWMGASSIRPGMYIRRKIYDGTIKMIKIISAYRTDQGDYKVKYEGGGFDFYGTNDKWGIYIKDTTYDEDLDVKEATPKELGLPTEVSIDIESLVDRDILTNTEFYDELYLDDIISDWLSDEYGFLHFGFQYEVVDNMVYISNIAWDTSSEDDEEYLDESEYLIEATGNFGTNDIINLCSPLQHYSDFDNEIKEWKEEDQDITEGEIYERIEDLMNMYHENESDNLKSILADYNVEDLVMIKPGYYNGFYIEFKFDDAHDLVYEVIDYHEYEEDAREDFKKVVDNITKALIQAVEEVSLVEYTIAYRFSNGETGYNLDTPYEKTIENIKAAFNKLKEEGIKIINEDPDLIHESIIKKDEVKVMSEDWVNWVEVLDLSHLTPEQDKLLARNIKQWYIDTYMDDVEGHDWIDAYVTFEEVLDGLVSHHGVSIYKLLGDNVDTVIRERIFEELSKILDVDYSDIYDMWLDN